MKKFAQALVLAGIFFFPCQLLAYQILTIGDSITKGWPYVLENPWGDRTGGYQPYLENYLSNDGLTSAVYNWGVGGETTVGGVARINDVLDSRGSDFMLIMEGANDLYAGISSSTTQANIGVMIDRVKAKGVSPVVGTITPNTMTSGFDYWIRSSYNPKILSIAKAKNAMIADQYDALRPNWNDLNTDGLHPNQAGYKLIAYTWFQVLAPPIPPKVNNITPITSTLLLK